LSREVRIKPAEKIETPRYVRLRRSKRQPSFGQIMPLKTSSKVLDDGLTTPATRDLPIFVCDWHFRLPPLGPDLPDFPHAGLATARNPEKYSSDQPIDLAASSDSNMLLRIESADLEMLRNRISCLTTFAPAVVEFCEFDIQIENVTKGPS
jgi:hypothetical protein